MELKTMTENGDLPEPGTAVDTTPQTYDEQVEGLADLLDDPETPDLKEGDQDHEAATDDPEGEVAEDAEDVDGEQAEDGPQDDYAGGRFAADNAKVKLEDGTVISVADLKRNNLFQRDYTVKTTELAEKRKQIDSRASEVDQLAQSLNQQREYVLWFAENYLPKQPNPSEMQTDPMGYLQRKEAWEQAQSVLNYFSQNKEAETRQKEEMTTKERAERARGEFAQLVEKAPELRDHAKRTSFFETAVKGAAEHYGFSESDIRQIEDHRMVLALRDALAYRRLKSKAPEVSKQVQKRPAMATGGKRAAPGIKDVRARQDRSERLRRDGSFEAGVASLMDLDL